MVHFLQILYIKHPLCFLIRNLSYIIDDLEDDSLPVCKSKVPALLEGLEEVDEEEAEEFEEEINAETSCQEVPGKI